MCVRGRERERERERALERGGERERERERERELKRGEERERERECAPETQITRRKISVWRIRGQSGTKQEIPRETIT